MVFCLGPCPGCAARRLAFTSSRRAARHWEDTGSWSESCDLTARWFRILGTMCSMGLQVSRPLKSVRLRLSPPSPLTRQTYSYRDHWSMRRRIVYTTSLCLNADLSLAGNESSSSTPRTIAPSAKPPYLPSPHTLRLCPLNHCPLTLKL
jgi:hypothetical protein